MQAIVTGASKGLGNALAHQLASKGYNLLLVARSSTILAEEAKLISDRYSVIVHFLALDLSQPKAASSIVDWCSKNQFEPTILVNNAGYSCWGFFGDVELHKHLSMMQVNMNTLVELTHSLIPVLKKHKKSFILNVASTAAFQAVPTQIVYAASKSFVRSFSRGLRYELRDTSISVTCLSPGPIATNFIKQAGMEAMQETAKKFEMSAEEVAKKGLSAMFKGKSESSPGFINFLNVRLSFIVPDAVLEKIAAALYMSKL